MTTHELREAKFDRARFEAGEMPTRTRGGQKVLWCADTKLNIKSPVVAIIVPDDGEPRVEEYTRDGRYFTSGRADDFDLVHVHEPKMRRVRIAVCRNRISGGIYTTFSDEHGDFDAFVAERREDGRLLYLIEVEVPE